MWLTWCDLPDVPWCDLPGVVWCAPPRITPIQRRLHCTFGKRFIIEVLDMEFDISGSFLTHPECNPSDHCFWWSMHLARHWLRSSDGRDSVLYCSHPSVEMSWLATKREEDSIKPDPDPVCPPARLVVVARMRWNNVAWRILTRWNANGEIFISKGFIFPWMGKQIVIEKEKSCWSKNCEWLNGLIKIPVAGIGTASTASIRTFVPG